MTETLTKHIWLDHRGIAWIDDTNVKVMEVAIDHLAHGWSAEEIHLQHRHLSRAQIHAALSFYFDDRMTIDAQIAERSREADRVRAELGPTPFEARLKAENALAG